MILEVCVDSLASALAAEHGGAERIELCSDLLEGGITPSPGLLAAIRERVDLKIYGMVRPRGGDFCYDENEFQVMRKEIEHLRTLGADGLVFGLLNEAGQVDVIRTKELIERARPLPVTFHRAIDMTPDPLASLEAVIATGADRILTSGGAKTAIEGLETLCAMQKIAQGRIKIIAASGVRPVNLRKLAKETGISEFHASLRRKVPSRSIYRKPGLTMGALEDLEFVQYATSEADVRAMITILDGLPHELPAEQECVVSSVQRSNLER